MHDVHDYEQDPLKLKEYFSHIPEGVVKCQIFRAYPDRQTYDPTKPIFVSEYGGIAWIVDGGNGWGYGNSVTSEEAFLERLKGLTDVLLDNADIFAYCYTQLTDVEQEQNGLLTYDRQFKFSPEIIHPIFSRKSGIED